MKRFFIAAAMLCMSTAAMVAQDMMPQMPPIPVDPDVRIGKLDNGLTYYIRHNEWPEKVANFYIAQRVGAIQEEESQRGLAHFLEHMAFNGSENFPNKPGTSILDFTRRQGVEFGSDLNAYTAIDKTVYRICNVPVAKGQAVLDSCLLVLRDWSCGLTIEADEIDKERDVVHNEWRNGESAQQRMITRCLPKMYPGSKYGERMPIGLMSVIDSFRPETLRAYYKKWYRPDNQAIIVVGDVDVDHTEAHIKQLFSGIAVPENAAQVVPEQVPDNEEPIFIVDKDKEQQMNSIMVFMKHEATTPAEKASMEYLFEVYIKGVISQMFNARLRELAEDPDCPFLGAQGDDDDYLLANTKAAWQMMGVPKEGRDMETLTALFREARRVAQFGFTATEYERAKANYLTALEKAYTNRAKISNDQFGNDYTDHYLTNEPIPSIEMLYQIMNQIAPNIPVEAINQVLPQLISDSNKNLVVMEWCREADGLTYPTEQEISDAIAKARAEEVTAYVDNVKNEPLMTQLPKAGKIKKEADYKFGAKELTLSNGATVILLPTDYKDDQVLLQAFAKGGKSLFGEADYTNLKVFDQVIGLSGLSNFSSTELSKVLAGKAVNADATMGLTRQYVTAHSTPKDLETMFQMMYLYFTSVSKDEKQFANLMNQLEMGLKNKGLSPDAVYSDSLAATIYDHNPRYMEMNVEDLKDISYDRILEIHKDRFKNASQFTFVIVGKFDEATIRPLIEQYVASLPGKGKPDDFRDVRTIAKGKVKNAFTVDAENKAMDVILWSAMVPYTLENSVLVDAAGQVLSMVYLKNIREEESAAYSCGASGGFNLSGKEPMIQLQAYCPMNPDKEEIAVRLLHEGIADCAKTVDAEQLRQVKETMLKQADISFKNNNYWVNQLTTWKDYGLDMHTDYKATVEALTPERLAAFFRDVILASGNEIEVIMTPAKK